MTESMRSLKNRLPEEPYRVIKSRGREGSMVTKGYVLSGIVEMREYEDGEVLFGRSAGGEWFQTSVIKSWTEDDEKISVETKNSTYDLYKVKRA